MKKLNQQQLLFAYIEQIRGDSPPKTLTVELAELFCVGETAIYRRFRAEVPLDYEQLLLLQSHYNIPPDKIFPVEQLPPLTYK